jgi:hypothetical protein
MTAVVPQHVFYVSDYAPNEGADLTRGRRPGEWPVLQLFLRTVDVLREPT